ncbi:hypothetical protein Tco_0607494, partial [Tanacetum coccineum]
MSSHFVAFCANGYGILTELICRIEFSESDPSSLADSQYS